jgi:hypothetical protein
METGEQWISKQAAARLLGFSEKTIDRRRRSGELASLKSTDSQGHVRISVASLEAFVAQRQAFKNLRPGSGANRCRSPPSKHSAPPRPPAAPADAVRFRP